MPTTGWRFAVGVHSADEVDEAGILEEIKASTALKETEETAQVPAAVAAAKALIGALTGESFFVEARGVDEAARVGEASVITVSVATPTTTQASAAAVPVTAPPEGEPPAPPAPPEPPEPPEPPADPAAEARAAAETEVESARHAFETASATFAADPTPENEQAAQAAATELEQAEAALTALPVAPA